ncbi:MAG TPA: MerR family transcriptional regulator [Chloroflexi bacterium]|jgi:DNA-binding transcriptional MerR regulator|nr:MerR family transcriptional regulator [Chloroflexota bacterium]
MSRYTVRQVADMAGVSVRTLHHYDRIGLLEPAARTAAGYRLYDEKSLLRLQQILFFKELDVPLDTIRSILDDSDFDEIEALQTHRRIIYAQIERLTHLLQTIDRTILRIKGDDMALSDEELYEGFSPEQAERYRREARERWGTDVVQASEDRLRKLPKEEWDAIRREGDEVTRGLAALIGRDPGDDEVQALIARHYAWVSHFWHPSAEAYRNLGRGYVEHDEFRAFYEQYGEGLAEFICAAMAYYADHALSD